MLGQDFSRFMAAIRIQLPGREEFSVIALDGAHITIGRSPANTIQIFHTTMSMHHAEMLDRGDHYWLRDLGSTNGVFVNGQRVVNHHLRESCKLAFGSCECEFVLLAPSDVNKPLKTMPVQNREKGMPMDSSKVETQLTNSQPRAEPVQRGTRSQKRTNKPALLREMSDCEPSDVEISLRVALAEKEQEVAKLRAGFKELEVVRKDIRQCFEIQKASCDALLKGSDLELLRQESEALEKAHDLLDVEAQCLRAALQSQRAENAELKAQSEALRRTLQSRDIEIEALRSCSPADQPIRNELLVPLSGSPLSKANDQRVSSGGGVAAGQLEQALGRLGFVVRPIRRETLVPLKASGNRREDTRDRVDSQSSSNGKAEHPTGG
jgi:hypothetical protein